LIDVAESSCGSERSLYSIAVGEIADGPYSHFSNSAEIAANPLRATLLAEPFFGRWLKGVSWCLLEISGDYEAVG
jgi:hypothetical protein